MLYSALTSVGTLILLHSASYFDLSCRACSCAMDCQSNFTSLDHRYTLSIRKMLQLLKQAISIFVWILSSRYDSSPRRATSRGFVQSNDPGLSRENQHILSEFVSSSSPPPRYRRMQLVIVVLPLGIYRRLLPNPRIPCVNLLQER